MFVLFITQRLHRIGFRRMAGGERRDGGETYCDGNAPNAARGPISSVQWRT